MSKRWTRVAWCTLAVFVLGLVLGLILVVANGTSQHDAINQLLLVLGVNAFMVVGP
jgi:hypothetical protein